MFTIGKFCYKYIFINLLRPRFISNLSKVIYKYKYQSLQMFGIQM